MEAFRQEVLQIYSRAGQTTVESMGGEIRFVRKWTPLPHPTLHQDEIDAADSFRGTGISGFDYYFPFKCLRTTEKECLEL
jgi:hypothetical protein